VLLVRDVVQELQNPPEPPELVIVHWLSLLFSQSPPQPHMNCSVRKSSVLKAMPNRN
jgi:hypothetical protein